MKIDIPVGRIPIDGPKPFRVEYPYGLPDDCFRRLAKDYNSTCISYHKGVDPNLLSEIENGNQYRYGPGDPQYEEIKQSMIQNGFIGGSGQRLIVFVEKDRMYLAEGNHRLKIALDVGVPTVEIQIHYKGNADQEFLLIPFDIDDPHINVISD